MPFDLNSLASNLRNQIASTSSIVLDASVFPDVALRTAIRAAFALNSTADLTIKGVKASDIPDPSAARELNITAGTTSVLKQNDIGINLTFSAPGETLEAIIAVEMKSTWKFKDSFAGLDTFPFKLLETSGARFVYATVEQPNYAWPGEPANTIRLEKGLNFLSLVTLQHLAKINSLLGSLLGSGSQSLKFYGKLAMKDGHDLPVGRLCAPVISNPVTVGVEPLALTLSKPAIAVEIGDAKHDSAVQDIDLLVQADFKTFEVAVGIPLTAKMLEVSVKPLPSGSSVKALIQTLPGCQNFGEYIPSELNDIFANVGLNNFSLIVTPEPKVSYWALSVGTLQPWEIMPELKLEQLSLEVQTVDPAGVNWSRVHIGATAKFLPKIFDGDFEFTLELEKTTAWEVQTVSGSYFGKVNLGKIVEGILGNSSSVPSVLKGIEFSDFGVNAQREQKGSPFTYSFYGSVEVGFPILDTKLASSLHLAVTKTSTGHKVELAGSLVIGESVFSCTLNLGDANAKLIASWETQGNPLGFNEIAHALGWDSMPPMPDGLDLGLKKVQFTYDFNKKNVALTAQSVNYGDIAFVSLITSEKSPNPKQRVYVFSIDIPLDLKFTKFPVVGESLAIDPPVGIDELQIMVASEALAEEDVKSLNALLAKPLMPKTLTKGVTLGAKLEMSGPHEVIVPLTKPAKKLQAEPAPPVEALETSLTSEPAPAPAYQADAKWFNLQKTLGPVTFDKIGVQYQSGTLRFLLNAALSAAGLTLSVDGLSVGSSLKKVDLQFDVRGLGIEYKAGDIEIGGAFLKTVRDGRDSYDGAAVIKTKQFALSALGSYTKLEGQPSLFIYAFLDYPLGGPSFFFVTGLAAGFGYNRRLIAPSIDKVSEFPLVRQAMGGRGVAPTSVMKALEALQTYVPPKLGSIFLAVGVKFNSFKLIDSFALLTLEFGNNFVINLLGISTAIVPTPEAGKTVTPLAQVQIAWKATFDPDEGCLGIDARLTPNSYILSKDCHLSGGFAFYSWFSGPHAGDFVQTLGGYHPEFEVPAHYPKVPRLAFDWRVSNSLTIQGNAYFALTGSALMAGGHLEVLFREGELRAWLKVGADFLIAWKPYHYDARMYVNVGASYTFDIDLLFGHIRKTISVDVGAQLHLWGPDFSGTARIDLSIITFTISFGAGASQTPAPLKEWSTFQKSFLPAKDVCSISVKDGLVRKIEKSGSERWVINPKELSLVIDSAIPFKSAPPGVDGQKDLADGANVDFGVGPMAVNAAKLNSTLTVTVKKGSNKVNSEFKCTVITKRVPAGLWGQNISPKVNGDSFIEQVPSGIEIVPGKQPAPGESAKIDLSVFKYSTAYYPDGNKDAHGPAFAWEAGRALARPVVLDAKARRDKIREGVVNNSARASLLKELGLKNDDVNIRASVADDFVSAPQVESL